MSNKDKTVEKTEVKKQANIENNVVNKEREVIETLRVQLQEHLQRAEQHRTMATKAQGALEVLLQLHPEEDNEN